MLTTGGADVDEAWSVGFFLGGHLTDQETRGREGLGFYQDESGYWAKNGPPSDCPGGRKPLILLSAPPRNRT